MEANTLNPIRPKEQSDLGPLPVFAIHASKVHHQISKQRMIVLNGEKGLSQIKFKVL